jgi:hypothetical protein
VDGAMDELDEDQDGDDTIQQASGVPCTSETAKTWSS